MLCPAIGASKTEISNERHPPNKHKTYYRDRTNTHYKHIDGHELRAARRVVGASGSYADMLYPCLPQARARIVIVIVLVGRPCIRYCRNREIPHYP